MRKRRFLQFRASDKALATNTASATTTRCATKLLEAKTTIAKSVKQQDAPPRRRHPPLPHGERPQPPREKIHKDEAPRFPWRRHNLKGEAPLAVAGACVGVSLFGYHLGVVNAPLQAMAARWASGTPAAGAVVSSTLVGAAGGALLAGPAADRLGRRGALRWNCLTLILAAVGCATATTLQHLIYARTLAGVGIGLVSAVAPLYVSEVSPAAKRGRNGALNQVAICLGIVASIVAGLGRDADVTLKKVAAHVRRGVGPDTPALDPHVQDPGVA